LSSPEAKGLSRPAYWLGWLILIGVVAPFAALPLGSVLGLAAMLPIAAFPVGVLTLWVLRLRNAGWSSWWVLLMSMAIGALILVANERFMMLEATQGPHRVSGFGTKETLQNAILPGLTRIVGLALVFATLIIGLLPTKSVSATKSQS
jgi:uncharacterized membrane protein YhaH (DUF805 family)